MIYVYPDDFLFVRFWHNSVGLQKSTKEWIQETMLKVHFRSVADEQEERFFQRFGLTRWEG